MTIPPRMQRIYKDRLLLLKHQMIEAARNGKYAYVFCAKRSIPLEPEYSLIDCLYFVYNELKKHRYSVMYIKPNMLLIEWGNRHAETEREKEEFLEYEHQKTTRIIETSELPTAKKIDDIIDELMQ